MSKTYVHVNVNNIKTNNKNIREGLCTKESPGAILPVIKIDSGKEVTYVNELEYEGKFKIVHRPFDPLPCGAKVWIEIDGCL